MKGDFHIHTTYSDGSHTVRDIIESTKRLDYFAITDHDTFSGAKEALALCGRKLIYGVEMSTFFKNENVHILGYFPDTDACGNLEHHLLQQQQDRVRRAEAIFELLSKHFNVTIDLKNIKYAESITRGSIARAIIAAGYPYTQKEIFDKMLGRGCPAYLPSTKLPTEVGIKLIKDARGFAFLAHPVLLKNIDPEEIIAFGIDGIEAVYPKNTKEQERRYRHLARRYGLMISGGSDFHYINDSAHANIGDIYLSGLELERFVAKMGKL